MWSESPLLVIFITDTMQWLKTKWLKWLNPSHLRSKLFDSSEALLVELLEFPQDSHPLPHPTPQPPTQHPPAAPAVPKPTGILKRVNTLGGEPGIYGPSS